MKEDKRWKGGEKNRAAVRRVAPLNTSPASWGAVSVPTATAYPSWRRIDGLMWAMGRRWLWISHTMRVWLITLGPPFGVAGADLAGNEWACTSNLIKWECSPLSFPGVWGKGVPTSSHSCTSVVSICTAWKNDVSMSHAQRCWQIITKKKKNNAWTGSSDCQLTAWKQRCVEIHESEMFQIGLCNLSQSSACWMQVGGISNRPYQCNSSSSGNDIFACPV